MDVFIEDQKLSNLTKLSQLLNSSEGMWVQVWHVSKSSSSCYRMRCEQWDPNTLFPSKSLFSSFSPKGLWSWHRELIEREKNSGMGLGNLILVNGKTWVGHLSTNLTWPQHQMDKLLLNFSLCCQIVILRIGRNVLWSISKYSWASNTCQT